MPTRLVLLVLLVLSEAEASEVEALVLTEVEAAGWLSERV